MNMILYYHNYHMWARAGKPEAADRKLNFADADQVSDWAVEALSWAVENGIMSGVDGGRIVPQDVADRAQGAVMLMQYHKLMNK